MPKSILKPTSSYGDIDNFLTAPLQANDSPINTYVAILDGINPTNPEWLPKCLWAIFNVLYKPQDYPVLEDFPNSTGYETFAKANYNKLAIMMGTCLTSMVSKENTFYTTHSNQFFQYVMNDFSLRNMRFAEKEPTHQQQIKQLKKLLKAYAAIMSSKDLVYFMTLSLAMLSLMSADILNETAQMLKDEETANKLKAALPKLMTNANQQLRLATFNKILNIRPILLPNVNKVHKPKLTWNTENETTVRYTRDVDEYYSMHPTSAAWLLHITAFQQSHEIVTHINKMRHQVQSYQVYLLNFYRDTWSFHFPLFENNNVILNTIYIQSQTAIQALNQIMLRATYEKLISYERLSSDDKKRLLKLISENTPVTLQPAPWAMNISKFTQESCVIQSIYELFYNDIDKAFILSHISSTNSWCIYFGLKQMMEITLCYAPITSLEHQAQLNTLLMKEDGSLLDIVPARTKKILAQLLERYTGFNLDLPFLTATPELPGSNKPIDGELPNNSEYDYVPNALMAAWVEQQYRNLHSPTSHFNEWALYRDTSSDNTYAYLDDSSSSDDFVDDVVDDALVDAGREEHKAWWEDTDSSSDDEISSDPNSLSQSTLHLPSLEELRRRRTEQTSDGDSSVSTSEQSVCELSPRRYK